MQTATQPSSNTKAIKITKASSIKTKPSGQTKTVATVPTKESNLERLLASCCDCV